MGQHTRDFLQSRRYFMPTPLPDEALETFADLFLSMVGQDPQAPAYSEYSFSKKQKHALDAERYYNDLKTERQSMSDIDVEPLAGETDLSDRERKVMEMCAHGYRLKEISETLKMNYRTVKRILKRIGNCMTKGPGMFTGVYHAEVHKQIYHKPTHCAAHPCRRLGYCKFTNLGKGSVE